MKMYLVMLLLVSVTALLAQTDPIQISGTITDASQSPISGAIVTLAKAKVSDTTDENGTFHISVKPAGVVREGMRNTSLPFSIRRNTVQLLLSSSERVKIDILSPNGRLLQSVCNGTLPAGSHRLTFKPLPSLHLCVLRCAVGKQVYTCRSIGTTQFAVKGHPTKTASALPGLRAAGEGSDSIDMLEIRHPDYTPQNYLLDPNTDTIVSVAIYSIDANWITELDSMYIDQEIYALGLDNGNYMAMGQNHSPAGDYELCFFTLDADGSVLTKNMYGSNENDLGRHFFLQGDGTVRVFGDMWYTRDASDWDLMTMTVSTTGDSLSSRVFSSEAEHNTGHGAVTADGGYVMAGHRSFIDEENRNAYIPCVTRILPDGSEAWSREYEWPYYFSLNLDIITLADGGFALAGYSYDDVERMYCLWVMKIDDNGDTVSTARVTSEQVPFVWKIFETEDNTLFMLGRQREDLIDRSYLARFSSDCSLEWDTTIVDSTRQIQCMTPLEDGTFLMAYNQIIKKGKSIIPEEEAIGLIQMKTDGTVVKDVGPIHHFGHPRSVALGKDNSILISSASGYTFSQQKFFIINVPNVFVE